MEYHFNDWNVELIQEPNKLLERIKEFNLKGKKIKSINIIGHCYDVIENFEEYIYLKRDKENSDIDTFKDDDEFERVIQYDDPIIIEFEDGNKFEIDYGEGSSLKIGLNSLPNNIECGCNNHNLDGNVMFSNVIGQSIIGFEVGMQDNFELTYEYTGSFGIEAPENQNSYISFFKIILTNGLRIYFSNYFDYGYMAIKEWDKTSKIKWKDAKKGILEEYKQMKDVNFKKE